MSKTLRADLFLLLVTFFWGATFPFISLSLQYISASELVFLRFLVAMLFFLPIIVMKLKQTDRQLIVAGWILGTLNAVVYLMQTLGMRDVNPDMTAFIAASGIIFVPFLAVLFGLSRVRKVEALGCIICLCGLYILTGAHLRDFSWGEGAILLASLAWAVSVCYVQKVTPKIKDLSLLAFYQTLFLLPAAFICAGLSYGLENQVPLFKPVVVFTILYTGIFATAVVFLLQLRYQKDTTATHAAIIYSLEPVLASVMAIYINHLGLTERVVVGGGIILLSILIIELLPRLPKPWNKKNHLT